ncbi:MAG: ECF transporter S component [Bacillota bacterium]|nr:ECF transporter S component [Candidatus Fermentithermobacillaceae bacterium]
MQGRHAPLLRLVTLSLLTAVVLIATMFLKLPTATGYIHLGDGIIFSVSLALGGLTGAVSGALGSFLADVLGGYPAWAPWTFVIKGIAGFITGKLGHTRVRNRQLLAMVLASLWVVFGYAVGTAFMYSPKAVWGEILGNLVQTGSGVIIGTVLTPVLESTFSHWNRKP